MDSLWPPVIQFCDVKLHLKLLMTLQWYVKVFWFPGVGLVGGGVVSFTACVNLMYVGRPAVMVSAILAARHRTFVLVVASLFLLFVFLCTINFFFFFFPLLLLATVCRVSVCRVFNILASFQQLRYGLLQPRAFMCWCWSRWLLFK